MALPRNDRVTQVREAWRRERPDVDTASVGVITPLWLLAGKVIANRERTLAAYDLDVSNMDVVSELRRAGTPYRLTAGELSRRCGVTNGATTQRVVRLEAMGFVRRVREEPDRRTVHVELTPAGVKRVDDVFADVIANDERMLDGLTGRDRADLERLLRRWLALMPTTADPGR